MERGNVLVIGNSGVGKSTLINAVLGEKKARADWGLKGTTDRLEVYESEAIPFRLIDSVGFEPNFIRARRAVNLVKKWSKQSAKDGKVSNPISVIWFCIDGCAAKLFPETIANLLKATAMWETVPVIAVVTKSYSLPDRAKNIEMINNAFAAQKHARNLRKVIPVVAETFILNESAFAPPEGIAELINATNELMPEGIKAGTRDINKFILNRKRALAQGLIGAATVAGVTVGAVPIPLADAAILSPLEVGEINAIARIYEIQKNEESSQFMNSIVEVGTVSLAAKTAISVLKAIPGINVAASVVNAVIAGSIVAAIGEGSVYAFEKVYLGEKNLDDIDWVKKMMESKLATQFSEKVKEAVEKVAQNAKSGNPKDIAKIIQEILGSQKKAV